MGHSKLRQLHGIFFILIFLGSFPGLRAFGRDLRFRPARPLQPIPPRQLEVPSDRFPGSGAEPIDECSLELIRLGGEKGRRVVVEQLGRLPFKITGEKLLDEDDLREKREGVFFTGLPRATVDPVEGVGFGFNGFLNSNGAFTDPFFPYTPYRSRIEAEASISTKGEKQIRAELDVPYVFDSKWRLRLEGGFEDNPNMLYFGSTAASMSGLNYAGRNYSRYQNYSDALGEIRAGGPGEPAQVTDTDYNTFRMRAGMLGASFEYAVLNSKLRLVTGLSGNLIDISTFDGKDADGIDPVSGQTRQVANGASLLAQDFNAGAIVGGGKSFITTLRAGVVFDTRDLEPDPSRGILVELTDELSVKPLGSRFNFNKIFFQAKHFVSLFPATFEDLVLASRIGLGVTQGDAPFYEYRDLWSSEGDIEGLGGLRTLRGFKQSRFLAPVLGVGNIELRYRFANAHFWGQRFKFKIAPFFDFGRVWNKLSDLSLRGYRANGGAGLRIAWNQSTILAFDYGTSSEDQQFFINFAHIF